MGHIGKVILPFLIVVVVIGVLFSLPDHLNAEGLDKVSKYLAKDEVDALDQVESWSFAATAIPAITQAWDPSKQQWIVYGRPVGDDLDLPYGYYFMTADENGGHWTDYVLLTERSHDFPDDAMMTHWILKCASSFSHDGVSTDSWTSAITLPFRYLINYASAGFGWLSVGGWYLIQGLGEAGRILNAGLYLVGFKATL